MFICSLAESFNHLKTYGLCRLEKPLDSCRNETDKITQKEQKLALNHTSCINQTQSDRNCFAFAFSTQAGRQAGRQSVRQAGSQAGRQAGRQAGSRAGSRAAGNQPSCQQPGVDV